MYDCWFCQRHKTRQKFTAHSKRRTLPAIIRSGKIRPFQIIAGIIDKWARPAEEKKVNVYPHKPIKK